MIQYFQGTVPGQLLFPEHKNYHLEALTLQEALAVGTEHQAGAEGIKKIITPCCAGTVF
jgi:hypothetical protein